MCFIRGKKRPPKTINSIINTRNMATESYNNSSTAALYGHQSRLVSAQSSCFHCCLFFFFFILFSHKSRLDDVYALSTLPQHETSLPFLSIKQDFSSFFSSFLCVCVCFAFFALRLNSLSKSQQQRQQQHQRQRQRLQKLLSSDKRVENFWNCCSWCCF